MVLALGFKNLNMSRKSPVSSESKMGLKFIAFLRRKLKNLVYI